MARAGPSRRGVETRACPLRQLQETLTGLGVCFRIYRPTSVIASHLGRCDSRHRFTLRYPMIFWTPRNRDGGSSLMTVSKARDQFHARGMSGERRPAPRIGHNRGPAIRIELAIGNWDPQLGRVLGPARATQSYRLRLLENTKLQSSMSWLDRSPIFTALRISQTSMPCRLADLMMQFWTYF
jgi:hypothetical protein